MSEVARKRRETIASKSDSRYGYAQPPRPTRKIGGPSALSPQARVIIARTKAALAATRTDEVAE